MPRALRLAYDTYVEAVAAVVDRRDRLDRAITAMVYSSQYTPAVRSLECPRGISSLTAFGMAVEVGDWERFSDPRSAPIWAW
jgi:transposase